MANQRPNRSRSASRTSDRNVNRDAEPKNDNERESDGRRGGELVNGEVLNQIARADDPSLELPGPATFDVRHTPEAAAAHVSLGTTDHLVEAAAAGFDEDDDESDAEDERDDPSGRDVTTVVPGLDPEVAKTVTAVGFDDGSQCEVKDGKLQRKSGGEDSNKESATDSGKDAEDKGDSKDEAKVGDKPAPVHRPGTSRAAGAAVKDEGK